MPFYPLNPPLSGHPPPLDNGAKSCTANRFIRPSRPPLQTRAPLISANCLTSRPLYGNGARSSTANHFILRFAHAARTALSCLGAHTPRGTMLVSRPSRLTQPRHPRLHQQVFMTHRPLMSQTHISVSHVSIPIANTSLRRNRCHLRQHRPYRLRTICHSRPQRLHLRGQPLDASCHIHPRRTTRRLRCSRGFIDQDRHRGFRQRPRRLSSEDNGEAKIQFYLVRLPFWMTEIRFRGVTSLHHPRRV